MAPKKARNKSEEMNGSELPEDRLGQLRDDLDPAQDNGDAAPVVKSAGKEKQVEALPKTESPTSLASKASRDDLLDEIRVSLHKGDEPEKKGFIGRLLDRLRGRSKAESAPSRVPPVAELVDDDISLTSETPKKPQRVSKKEKEAIQEFFADLEALDTAEPELAMEEMSPEVQQIEEEKQPEKKVPRLVERPKEKDIDLESIRNVALEEYDDTKIEVEPSSKTDLREEVRETIREARPFEKFLIIVALVLTVGTLLGSGIFLISKAVVIPTPVPTATEGPFDIIHPIRITLEGGWRFDLRRGEAGGGVWNPQGAEWLVGTEINRWIALPWTLQLEAVVRTLKEGDEIELMMSNLDVLTYRVHSRDEMSMEEILAQDVRTPGLLVVLYGGENENEDTYWVIMASPVTP